MQTEFCAEFSARGAGRGSPGFGWGAAETLMTLMVLWIGACAECARGDAERFWRKVEGCRKRWCFVTYFAYTWKFTVHVVEMHYTQIDLCTISIHNTGKSAKAFAERSRKRSIKVSTASNGQQAQHRWKGCVGVTNNAFQFNPQRFRPTI